MQTGDVQTAQDLGAAGIFSATWLSLLRPRSGWHWGVPVPNLAQRKGAAAAQREGQGLGRGSRWHGVQNLPFSGTPGALWLFRDPLAWAALPLAEDGGGERKARGIFLSAGHGPGE